MTSEEYRAKRREVLERFGDFDEMSKLAIKDVYMNKVVSCLIYGEENEYELILELINIIDLQSEHIKRLYRDNYKSIISQNERT